MFFQTIYIYHTLIPWERFCFHAFLSLPVTTRDLCQRLTCDPATHWLHNNSPTGTKVKRFIYELRRSRENGKMFDLGALIREKKHPRTRLKHLKHSTYGIYQYLPSKLPKSMSIIYLYIYTYIIPHIECLGLGIKTREPGDHSQFFVRFLFSRERTYSTLGTFRSFLAHQVDLRQKLTAESGDLWEVVGSSTVNDDEPQSPSWQKWQLII